MSLIASPVQELLIVLVGGLKAPGWNRVKQQTKASELSFFTGRGPLEIFQVL